LGSVSRIVYNRRALMNFNRIKAFKFEKGESE